MADRLRIPYYKPRQKETDPPSLPIDYGQLQRDFFEIENVVNGITIAVTTGWDAVVDGNLTASDPANHRFMGIYEAINYLGANGFVTANILVNRYATGYAEVANVTLGTLTRIWLYAEDQGQQSWQTYGTFGPSDLRLENFLISGPISAGNVPISFGGGNSLYVNDAFLFQGNTSVATFAGNYITFISCQFAMNFGAGAPTTTFAASYQNTLLGCELSVVSATASSFLFSGQQSYVDVAYGGTSGTLSFGSGRGWAFVSDAQANTRFSSGATQHVGSVAVTAGDQYIYGDTGTLTVSGGNLIANVIPTGNVSVTSASNVLLDGIFGGSITVSNGGAKGSIRGTASGNTPIDLQGGPWTVDFTNSAYNGAGLYFRARSGVIDSIIRLGAQQSVAGGTPYQLDAGANRNFLDFAGATTFTNAGVDNGTGNTVRQT